MQSPPLNLDRSLADYADVTDDEQWHRLHTLAAELTGSRVLHVNSTASGGGVAELLQSLLPLFNDLGVDTDWLVLDANEPFFEVTKAMHNGLQGQDGKLTDEMKTIYRTVTQRNATALTEEYDVIILHDPQSLGLIPTLTNRFPDTPLVWRCHIDLTAATAAYLEFVTDYVRQVDHAVFSRPEYGQRIDLPTVPSTVIHPSIDPLSEKNRPLTRSERAIERDRLDMFSTDDDTPVLTQVSRFDPWKDPLGVVKVHRQLKAAIPDAQLVLAGGMADDDPEGAEVYDRVVDATRDDPDIHLLKNEPDTTINFLQRRSDVVVQKSLREGFGLVVSEALWKRTPVIGSKVGGIPLQIDEQRNGYLVDPNDTEAVARRAEQLLSDEEHREQLGQRGRETVRERFLLPRHLLDYLELIFDIQSDHHVNASSSRNSTESGASN